MLRFIPSSGGPAVAFLALALGCAEVPEDPGVVHLTDLARAAGIPAARETQRVEVPSSGWTGGGAALAPLASGFRLGADGARSFAAGPSGLGWSRERLESVELRVRMEGGRSFRFFWDHAGGDLSERLGRGEDPADDPVYRSRHVRVRSSSAGVQTFRLRPATFATEDGSPAIDRIFLVPEWDTEDAWLEVHAVAGHLRIHPADRAELDRVARGGVTMDAIRLGGGAELALSVSLPASARLLFSYAAERLDGLGAIELAVGTGSGRDIVFRGELEAPGDWRREEVDLCDYAGTVDLALTAEGPGGCELLLGAPVLVGARGERRNVLVHEIDTMRADVLGSYGFPGRTSPVIGALARGGTLFADCQAASSWTRPSAASILTGLSAVAHGVVHESVSLPVDAVTLAERLRAEGWYTVAFMTNPNAGSAAGLDRGFDLVFETQALFDLALRHDDFDGPASSTAPSGTSRRAFLAFRDWFPAYRDVPLFIYVHPNDPHAPYAPRPPLGDGLLGETLHRGVRPGPGFAKYAGDVAWADHFLGELLDCLSEAGARDRTVTALVADHGEEFREHRKRGHGVDLHVETLRIPLVLHAPGRVPAGRIHRGRVSALDVFPTLLDLVGVDGPPGIEGESLLPLLVGPPDATSAEAHFAHLLALGKRQNREVMADSTVVGEIAVFRDRWKLIVKDYGNFAPRRRQLFDRHADPGETRNLAEGRPALAGELERLARSWYAIGTAGAETPDGATEVDPAAVAHLRALGYVD